MSVRERKTFHLWSARAIGIIGSLILLTALFEWSPAFAAAAAIGVGLELIDPVVLSPGHLEAVGPAPLLGNVYRLG